MNKINYIIDEIADQYMLDDNNRPWIIGFSGGKDPGWTGLYKYRWRGERLDTLEYIYPDPTTKGRTFIKMHISTDFSYYRDDIKKGTRLPSLPQEYKTVEDLDWFLLYGEGTFDTDF